MNSVAAEKRSSWPEEVSELKQGDCLAGRYLILGVLGVGGMATVYKANDLRLKRDVAVKVIHPELRKNWKTLQRFMRESQAMASLDSPRVVPVYDVGQDGERYFMVMKLIDAPSLSDLLDRGPLPEHRALAIVAGVVEGLRELHAKGIVHRDVKPSNIVVEEGDRPMLLDFGIVLEISEPALTQEGMLVGTPHYMAPEQIFAPTSVDGRADLYAVGVLLFELLTARLPYEGKTPAQLVQLHARNDVPDPKALAPGLSRKTTSIVRRALTKDLTKRFQNADELLAALHGEAEPAEELTEDLQRAALKRDYFGLGLVGLALLALAGFVIAWSLLETPTAEVIVAEVKPLAPQVEPQPQPEPAAEPEPEPVIEVPEVVEPAKSAKPRKPAVRKRSKPAEKAPFLAALPSNDPEVKRAQAMLRNGDTRGAIRLLNGLIHENPESPAPYPTLGDGYVLTGNKVAAIAAYRRYLALSPRGEGARNVEQALVRLGGR